MAGPGAPLSISAAHFSNPPNTSQATPARSACVPDPACAGVAAHPSDSFDVWTDVSVLNPVSPPPLTYSTMSYDLGHQSIILFGGLSSTGATNYTWEFKHFTWTNLTPTLSVSPPARYHASMSYNLYPSGIVLFGGEASGTDFLGDSWFWNGSAWSEIAAGGLPTPAPRAGASFAYDYKDTYGVLFGGTNGSYNFNDTWTVSGGQWTQVHPAHSPPARYFSSESWDENSHDVLLFGGTRMPGQGFADTWTYAGGSWTSVNALTPPLDRELAGADFDFGLGQVLLFGGFNPEGCSALGDTWSYTSSLWREQYNTETGSYGPLPRDGAALAFDSNINFAVLFGGEEGTCSPNQYVNDTWVFGPWTQPPPALLSATLVAAPSSGPAPLATELTAKVTGGIQPYTVDFTFDDGTPDVVTTTVGVASANDTYTQSQNFMPHVTVTDAALHAVSVSTTVSVGSVMVGDWYPPRDTYQFYNFGDYWSGGGNCYGISSSEILYWEHDIRGSGSAPYLPTADPATSSLLTNTSDPKALNATSLAIMQHQTEDPNIGQLPWFFWSVNLHPNWNELLGYLKSGFPITMGLGFNDLHAVVAFGEQQLANGTFLLDISDPNEPRQTTHGFYDPNANQFTYGAAGWHWHGFDVLSTGVPRSLQPSWYYPFGDPWNIWNDSYFTSGSGGFTFIAAIEPITVTAGTGTDSFGASGNSQTFVNHIPGSSGIEEDTVQVYAIPDASVGPGLILKDPSVGSSVFQVLRANNSTGSLVLTGFSVAVDSVGPHSFTLRPNPSGFGLDIGNVSNDTAWANLTFYHLAHNQHAELNASLLDFSSGSVANFTVLDWSGLSSTTTSSVTVTVTSAHGGATSTYHLVNGQIGLTPHRTPPGVGNSNATDSPFYATHNFWIGLGIGAVGMVVVAVVGVILARREARRGSRSNSQGTSRPPLTPP
ncbi:MAG: PKD domain-containing protein [Thermoplasmata archaeon]|nr:PKD domain-containing protein [Thermoplasmata archaeon]